MLLAATPAPQAAAEGQIMHEIRAIREKPEAFDEGLRRRGLSPRAESLIALDEKRRAAIAALQTAQERRNAVSKQIGVAMARKDTVAADDYRAEVAGLKATMPELEAAERDAAAALEAELAAIPNLPLDDTPDGKDENDNVEVRRHGILPDFPQGFEPEEHFQIGERVGLMDFEAAAKLSGARFVVLKGALARLERALEQFMLDLHTSEHGYVEVSPPVLVRGQAMFGTAQLPKFEDDQYQVASKTQLEHAVGATTSDVDVRRNDETGRQEAFERYWLIPTAEVPLTNLVRESIVDEKDSALALHSGDFVVSCGSGRSGPRHARHDPSASVQKGRARVDHHARAVARRA